MVRTILNQDNIEKGKAIIADLVARFDSNKGFFTSNVYKEELYLILGIIFFLGFAG